MTVTSFHCFDGYANATVGGLCRLTSFWTLLFQWLRVTRASDPPVPYGHRLCFVLCYNTLRELFIRKGTVSYASPNVSPYAFSFVRVQSHSREYGMIA